MPSTGPRFPIVEVLIAGVVVVAIAVGAVALLRIDPSGESGSGLSDAFKYDLQKYQKIDATLFRYHPVAEIPIDMREPRAITIGTDEQILVAGDKALQIFSPLSSGEQHTLSPFPLGEGQGVRPDGTTNGTPTTGPKNTAPSSSQKNLSPENQNHLSLLKQIPLDAEPYSLTVANAEHAFPGRIYVGMWEHVEVFEPDGVREAVWKPLGIVTSIATSDKEVFVADAKAKSVWRFGPDGKSLGQIGRRAESHDAPGFIVPSPYFAVAMSPDGMLRVANPGAHRVEAYTLDGQLELSWGQASEQIEGFCGCCNPAHMAILPDGRIVTAEKGLPRVKVYGSDGTFEGVVAGPETLLPSSAAAVETRDELRLRPVTVAADSLGRIYVLDPAARRVRVFAENEK